MKTNCRTRAAVIVVTVFIGTICILNFSPKARGRSRPRLFSLLSAAKDTSSAVTADKNSLASVRESEISFNIPNPREINSFDKLNFPLLNGRVYEAVQSQAEGLEIRSDTDFTWRGKLREEDFSGDVVLTFKEGAVSGLIYAPDAVYEIVPKGEQEILVELDQSKFPECAGDIKPVVPENEGKNSIKISNAVAPADSGDRIDVLVVYTASVKNALGGDTQAQTLAQQAIDATNTAYLNSKIRQRVRLVNAQETSIVETGVFATELSTLRTDANVANLREQYRADLVAMLTSSTADCGIGYLMGSTAGSPTAGFTVTSRTCAAGNLSLAHELGHNMGSQHNPENGSGAVFPYSYGHYVNGSFRTVMSYVDPCTSGCNRVAYFSNPAVFFNGNPTGIADARDNARSINNTADTIANYRYSGASLTMNNYNDGEIFPRIVSKTLSWSSDNITGNVKIEISRDESTNWKTLIASTPNDGAETISISGVPTKKARLRIVSLNTPAISDSSVRNIAIR